MIEMPTWLQAGPLYLENMEIRFSTEVQKEEYLHFHEVEKQCFREELWYNFDEYAEFYTRNHLILLNVFKDQVPIAVLVGYDGQESGTYYLDVIATALPGRGIGKKLLNWLISSLKHLDYRFLICDTEHVSEKGQPLVTYYQSLGFDIVTEKDGNVTMSLTL